MSQHCHIGEIRPGTGTVWVSITWDQSELPIISFHDSKLSHHKISIDLVPQTVKALLSKGHRNLIIEEAR